MVSRSHRKIQDKDIRTGYDEWEMINERHIDKSFDMNEIDFASTHSMDRPFAKSDVQCPLGIAASVSSDTYW